MLLWRTLGGMTSDDTPPHCDLCGDPIPLSGGYGSGALVDGLYCSLRCYALSTDRYAPPLVDLAERKGVADDDEPSFD
jgi:hypothetical protein